MLSIQIRQGFTYGFRPSDDTRASCILSQTSLTSSGSITPEELRDGILAEVRKQHPDVKLSNTETVLKPVKFGEGQGILLELAFKDGTEEIKRVEVIALGKSIQAIAYCESFAQDNPRYYNDFTTFFSSLKLTK